MERKRKHFLGGKNCVSFLVTGTLISLEPAHARVPLSKYRSWSWDLSCQFQWTDETEKWGKDTSQPWLYVVCANSKK